MRSFTKLMLTTFVIPSCLVGCAHKDRTASLEDKSSHITEVQQNLQPQADMQKAARLYIELGLAYLKDGQVGRAKEKLLRAKKLAPKLPEVHHALGYYMESVGEVDQAQRYYLDAIALNPKAGVGHNNYGTFLCRQAKFLEAEQEFLKAVEDREYSQIAEAYENAGLCVGQIPNVAKAREYFERAVRMDPNRLNAVLELAMLGYKENSTSTALEYLSLFNQKSDPNARSLWLGIKLAEKMNDTNKRASYSLLLKNKFPHSAEYQEMKQIEALNG